jgi:hypothetical protein
MSRRNLLFYTCWFIAVVQFILGFGFLFAPSVMARSLGLAAAPEWTNWLFGMMAARFIGFGYGMIVAARNPEASVPWIKAMIGVQVIDWLVTVYYLWDGAVSLVQVNTASFFPILFIAFLWAFSPLRRQLGTR